MMSNSLTIFIYIKTCLMYKILLKNSFWINPNRFHWKIFLFARIYLQLNHCTKTVYIYIRACYKSIWNHWPSRPRWCMKNTIKYRLWAAVSERYYQMLIEQRLLDYLFAFCSIILPKLNTWNFAWFLYRMGLSLFICQIKYV